jgi:sec-independent protein translocase protein TatB
MFDIGFSELVVIAVVALVVIGPERLPTVARTVGALLGRLNRYVSDVKADVEREMRLEEMKKLRAEVEAQAAGIERQVVGELEATRAAASQPLAEINQSLADVMHETGNANEATQPVQAVIASADVPTGIAPKTTSGVATATQAADASGTKA